MALGSEGDKIWRAAAADFAKDVPEPDMSPLRVRLDDPGVMTTLDLLEAVAEAQRIGELTAEEGARALEFCFALRELPDREAATTIAELTRESSEGGVEYVVLQFPGPGSEEQPNA